LVGFAVFTKLHKVRLSALITICFNLGIRPFLNSLLHALVRQYSRMLNSVFLFYSLSVIPKKSTYNQERHDTSNKQRIL